MDSSEDDDDEDDDDEDQKSPKNGVGYCTNVFGYCLINTFSPIPVDARG